MIQSYYIIITEVVLYSLFEQKYRSSSLGADDFVFEQSEV